MTTTHYANLVCPSIPQGGFSTVQPSIPSVSNVNSPLFNTFGTHPMMQNCCPVTGYQNAFNTLPIWNGWNTPIFNQVLPYAGLCNGLDCCVPGGLYNYNNTFGYNFVNRYNTIPSYNNYAFGGINTPWTIPSLYNNTQTNTGLYNSIYGCSPFSTIPFGQYGYNQFNQFCPPISGINNWMNPINSTLPYQNYTSPIWNSLFNQQACTPFGCSPISNITTPFSTWNQPYNCVPGFQGIQTPWMNCNIPGMWGQFPVGGFPGNFPVGLTPDQCKPGVGLNREAA